MIALNAQQARDVQRLLLSLHRLLCSGIRSGRCDLIKRLPGFDITLFDKVTLQSQAADQWSALQRCEIPMSAWRPEKFNTSDNKKALPHAEERLL
ncbi:hypothetical protein CDD79_10310 [Raoultella ornithinolytica]|nr:hypothetical protein CDD79_10310 [Raoultella ornithinolytica]PQH33078.1 hypothetical protein C5T95_05970 [Raoultella ornithinolytica]